jgi:hypothetical protein
VAYISDQQIAYFLKDLDRGERAIQSRIALDTRDLYDDRNGYSTCAECGSSLFQAGYPQLLCAACAREE